MKKALGLIETIGLVTAIEAADAAVKAANVTLVGYENTRGGGKITVKVVGDVGAVQAAVAAGVVAAERIGRVFGQRIIPRPGDDLDAVIATVARGQKPMPEPVPLAAPEPAAPHAAPAAVVETVVAAAPAPEIVEEALEPDADQEGEPEPPAAERPANVPANPTRSKGRARGSKHR